MLLFPKSSTISFVSNFYFSVGFGLNSNVMPMRLIVCPEVLEHVFHGVWGVAELSSVEHVEVKRGRVLQIKKGRYQAFL